MRKINSPLLVFALTYVNEDLISLTLWRKNNWQFVGDSSHPMGPSGIEAAPGEVTVSLGRMGGSLQASIGTIGTIGINY